MAGDIVPTENDYRIALRATVFQAKAHKVGDMLRDGRMIMSDELHAYLLHLANVMSTQYAMDRHIQNALHRVTLNSGE